MGREGAMLQSNQSLKANRKLVGKRKENRFSFVHTSTEKTEYDLPEASKEELRRIKEKLQRENKIRMKKRLVLFGVSMTLIISTFIYFVL